ncbi:MAG TPA: hypothetical protein VKC64_11825 [Burkholderiales bacterium]|nr:hypothetical protein [Burkholderiales bacterium]
MKRRRYRKKADQFVIPVQLDLSTDGFRTKEGASRYRKGDYIVFDDRTGTDGYCMCALKFRAMYALAKQAAAVPGMKPPV